MFKETIASFFFGADQHLLPLSSNFKLCCTKWITLHITPLVAVVKYHCAVLLKMQNGLQFYYIIQLQVKYECKLAAHVQHFIYITGEVSLSSNFKLGRTCAVNLHSYWIRSSTGADLQSSTFIIRRSNECTCATKGTVCCICGSLRSPELHTLEFQWRQTAPRHPYCVV